MDQSCCVNICFKAQMAALCCPFLTVTTKLFIYAFIHLLGVCRIKGSSVRPHWCKQEQMCTWYSSVNLPATRTVNTKQPHDCDRIRGRCCQGRFLRQIKSTKGCSSKPHPSASGCVSYVRDPIYQRHLAHENITAVQDKVRQQTTRFIALSFAFRLCAFALTSSLQNHKNKMKRWC